MEISAFLFLFCVCVCVCVCTYTHTHILLYFKFWGTCTDLAGLLHRYTHAIVVCCLHPPVTHIRYFSQCYPSPISSSPAIPLLAPTPQQTPVCDVPLLVSMCSRCSTSICEWGHVVVGFLSLCYFAESDGFQPHSCLYKGHEIIRFMAA